MVRYMRMTTHQYIYSSSIHQTFQAGDGTGWFSNRYSLIFRGLPCTSKTRMPPKVNRISGTKKLSQKVW